ncbi:MAG: DedA family protein [Pseudomonadota bacterium]
MDLGTLIETHGYWVLAAGSVLEGETVLVLAGFAAHRGYLSLPWVIGVAAAAGFAGDQFFFWLGRRHGAGVLSRFPAAARQADMVHRLIERHHEWLIVGVRFAYGLRIAGPILIGTSPVAAARFALFNAIGALAWATLIGGLGWLFGAAVERLLGEIRRIEVWLFVALAAIGIALALAHAWRQRRRP